MRVSPRALPSCNPAGIEFPPPYFFPGDLRSQTLHRQVCSYRKYPIQGQSLSTSTLLFCRVIGYLPDFLWRRRTVQKVEASRMEGMATVISSTVGTPH